MNPDTTQGQNPNRITKERTMHNPESFRRYFQEVNNEVLDRLKDSGLTTVEDCVQFLNWVNSRTIQAINDYRQIGNQTVAQAQATQEARSQG